MIDLSHAQRSNSPTTLNELFEALSHPTRRRILTAFLKEQPQEAEKFVPSDFTQGERREEVMVSLQHRHLPKLAEAGFIEWDPDTKTITQGPRFDEITPLVELIIEHRDELPADWP